jgi:RNA polymerase sigma factor (sigma-70 family)
MKKLKEAALTVQESTSLPPELVQLAERYSQAVARRFPRGTQVKVTLRRENGHAVLDIEGVPADQVHLLIEALSSPSGKHGARHLIARASLKGRQASHLAQASGASPRSGQAHSVLRRRKIPAKTRVIFRGVPRITGVRAAQLPPEATHEIEMAEPDRQASFLTLLDEHRRILYKVSRVYGRTAADRDDLVQETVVQLWRSFPRYDARFRFSTWMYRIALNVALSFQRRESTRQQHLTAVGDEVLQVAGEGNGEPEEELELLYRSIERLDDLNKALVLLYLDGHSHAEIAEVLGISTSNVGTRIGRLKDRLRDELRTAELSQVTEA